METRIELFQELSYRRLAIVSVIDSSDANWLELVLTDDNDNAFVTYI